MLSKRLRLSSAVAVELALQSARSFRTRAMPRLDVVVNAAGISYVAPVALANIERCQEVLQINLMGAFMLSRSAVRLMTRQRYGRIVHIGSIAGSIGASYNAIYAASKAGIPSTRCNPVPCILSCLSKPTVHAHV